MKGLVGGVVVFLQKSAHSKCIVFRQKHKERYELSSIEEQKFGKKKDMLDDKRSLGEKGNSMRDENSLMYRFRTINFDEASYSTSDPQPAASPESIKGFGIEFR